MADGKEVSIEQAVSLSGLRPLLLKALEGKLEGEEESIRKILYGAISGYSYEAQVQSIVNKELDRLLGEALRSAIGETFREYAQPLIRQRVADAIRSVIQEPVVTVNIDDQTSEGQVARRVAESIADHLGRGGSLHA